MASYEKRLTSIGFYEVFPTPTTDELEKHYSEKYFQSNKGSYKSQYLPDELRYFNNIASVALETVQVLNLEESLLDLGCGEGYFSKSFQEFEWRITCCDYSSFAITSHNPGLLPNFILGDVADVIESQEKSNKKYGLVNMSNVLEHVPDPVALLRDCKRLLGPRSVLRVKVPNDFSDFQLELVKGGFSTESWFAPPEHLSYFNRESLIKVLEFCGYQVLSIQADFPIEVFLANSHSNYWRNRDLGNEAHKARVFCENYLIEKSVSDYVSYSEAQAKLGFGRELIAYAKPIDSI